MDHLRHDHHIKTSGCDTTLRYHRIKRKEMADGLESGLKIICKKLVHYSSKRRHKEVLSCGSLFVHIESLNSRVESLAHEVVVVLIPHHDA